MSRVCCCARKLFNNLTLETPLVVAEQATQVQELIAVRESKLVCALHCKPQRAADVEMAEPSPSPEGRLCRSTFRDGD